MNDGGDPVSEYKLYRDDGDDFTSGWTEITNYDGSSDTYTVVAGDGIVTGKIYRFTYAATNNIGDSERSNDLIAGVGSSPSAPTTISRNSEESSATSMLVEWTKVTGSDLEILGYKLYVDDGLSGVVAEVYDGSVNPQVREYRIDGLVPGRTYSFKASAFDINGEGTLSATATEILSCIDPSGMADPVLESVDET